MKPSFVTPILQKIARKAGVKIVVEPEYRYAGQVILPDGRKRYFKGTYFDLNPAAASEIAKDKAYTDFFLKKMGYSTIEGEAFFTDEWCRIIGSDKNAQAAYRYARTLGFPVIVKPNDLSQGAGVCKAHGKKEFFEAIARWPARVRVFLVQRVAPGSDYRMVVLDGEVISAYRRIPLAVTGDGRSSIRQLLRVRQRFFARTGRDTVINIDDPRIAQKLKRQKLTLDSIPASDQSVTLLDNANLSTGGEAQDVTAILHPSYRKLATAIPHDMGLRFCGVDIMSEGDIASPCTDYHVIEINASPGLDHYADIGKQQQKTVEDLYLKVLLALKA
jgi:D-alanine-D-alanine ligase-like ATP-grasp enzyme